MVTKIQKKRDIEEKGEGGEKGGDSKRDMDGGEI